MITSTAVFEFVQTEIKSFSKLRCTRARFKLIAIGNSREKLRATCGLRWGSVLCWWGSGARFLEAPCTQEKRALDEDATALLFGEGVQEEKSAGIGISAACLSQSLEKDLATA